MGSKTSKATTENAKSATPVSEPTRGSTEANRGPSKKKVAPARSTSESKVAAPSASRPAPFNVIPSHVDAESPYESDESEQDKFTRSPHRRNPKSGANPGQQVPPSARSHRSQSDNDEPNAAAASFRSASPPDRANLDSVEVLSWAQPTASAKAKQQTRRKKATTLFSDDDDDVAPTSNAVYAKQPRLPTSSTQQQQEKQQQPSVAPSSYYAAPQLQQQPLQQGYYAQQLVQQQAPQPPPVRQPSRYQVLYGEELGSGGYGTVYKAFDTFTGEYVAVKETQLGRASQEALRQALRSEFEVLTRLDHPHIVKVLSFSCDDGKSQIFMEWLPSGSVSHILCGTGFRFHERVIRRYTSEALRGLAYLHSQGLLHRDIKPGNMLVTGSAVVKLSDFGTSKHVTQASAPSTAQIVGTPSYMSKEAIALGKYSKGSDVWAMACSVVEMASGRPPWSELPAEQQAPIPLMFRIGSAMPPDNHPAIPPHLSAELQALLRRMFAADPEQRPSAEALLADPYFTNSDLPDSAESADAFQDALREAFKSRQQSVSSMTVSSAWLLTGSSAGEWAKQREVSDESQVSGPSSATGTTSQSLDLVQVD